MAAADWLGILLRLINALLEMYRSSRRKARTDTVRADPGSAWLRKFGGKDKRPSSGSSNSGDHSDG